MESLEYTSYRKKIFHLNFKFRNLAFTFLSIVFFLLCTNIVSSQILWSNAGGSAWLTGTNWTGGAVPSGIQIAQFGANPTAATGVGINFSGATNNGAGNQAAGGVEIISARTTAFLIGNSSNTAGATGTLTLNGATINSIPNTILRNSSGQNFTIQNIQGSGNQTMSLTLGNPTDNIITLDGSGNIVISSIIVGTTASISFSGIGGGRVDITNAANTFTSPINIIGSEVRFTADGSFGNTINTINVNGGRLATVNGGIYTLISTRGIQVGNATSTSISTPGAGTLTYNGIIADLAGFTPGAWAKQGGGSLSLGGVSTYTGATSINNGFVKLAIGNNRLPTATSVNLGQAASSNLGTLDLNGFNQTIAGLNSLPGTNATAANNTVTSTASAILTLNSTGTFNYGDGSNANSGIISGAISLVKTGIGLQTLGDANTYTGTTTISSGELRFNPSVNTNFSGLLNLNGGTFGTTGIAATRILTFSSCDLSQSSNIDLGTANDHTISFTSAGTFTSGQTLTIFGWQGVSGMTGTKGKVFFGSSGAGLSAAQLAQIQFNSGNISIPGANTPAIILSTGELVPLGVVNNSPTIVMSISTTDYLDGGVVISPPSPYAISGVISDPTDPASTLGVIFTIDDIETAASGLTLIATSSNLTVVPNANIIITGSGANRTVKITAATVGYSTITVVVSDGVNSSSYILKYAGSAASVNPSTTRFLTGTSDASTAQGVDANYMFVGDDENQGLRLYNRQNSGLPAYSVDYSVLLNITPTNPEVDIEGSVRIGNRIYWLGSHSNSANSGSARPNRYRVFATDVSGSGIGSTLSYVGRYDDLRTDLLNWDASNGHGLGANFLGLVASAAPGVIPEEPDGSGFNIEGFSTAPDDVTGFICFRAPISPAGNRINGLVVPLTNLASLVAGNPSAGPATFGAPIFLNLGGRGIREMKRNASGQYIIIAGPAGSGNDFKLYTWTGNAADAPQLRSADLTALMADGSPESIVDVPDPLLSTSILQLLIDNGDTEYYGDGTIAKILPNNNHKKFRSELVQLGCAFPLLASNPHDTTICESGIASFTGSFTNGDPAPTLRWQVQTGGMGSFIDLTNTAPYSGTTTPTLVITNPDFSFSTNKYRLKASNTCGDVFTTSALLIVNDSPNLSGASVVCVGNTIQLSPSSGGTWMSSNTNVATITNAGVVTGVAPGMATFTFTITATGCSATTAPVNVYLIPVSTITSASAIYQGSIGNVASVPNAGPGATYMWSLSSGMIFSGASTNMITYNAGTPPSMTISVTVTNGCSSSSAKSVAVLIAGPSSFQWVPDYVMPVSCGPTTNCCVDTLCFNLKYTPGVTGSLTTYTTGFFTNCPGGMTPLGYNHTCMTNDNSFQINQCSQIDSILFNSSGNDGGLPVMEGVPVILHRVCLNISTGESIQIREDQVTSLSTSIDQTGGGQVTEFPSYATQTFSKPAPSIPANITANINCPADTIYPVPPPVVDFCGNSVPAVLVSTVSTPSPLTCEGSKVYTFNYTDCSGYSQSWSYKYIIERLPFADPPDAGVTVACPTAANMEPTSFLPVVMSNCGEILTPSAPVVSPPVCTGPRTYTYTYTDCEGSTQNWVFTYTILPNNSLTLVCPADLVLSCTAGTNYIALINTWIVTATATDACDANVVITNNYDGISIPSFSCRGGLPITFTATDNCGNFATCVRTVTKPCFNLDTWVYLEGAAASASGGNAYSLPMRTTLNDLRLLPGQLFMDPFFGNRYALPGQPYNIAPWLYPGTEGSLFDSGNNPSNANAGYPSTVVDWVLVSLRLDSAGTGGPVCEAAALLHKDGHVEFVQPLNCCAVSESSLYYVVIEHRNHLIVMSHVKQAFVNHVLSYDFRFQQSYEDPIFAGLGLFSRQKQILPGKYAMFAGNGYQAGSLNGDTDINFDDRSYWESQNSSFGMYKNGDYNMNGDTNFNDRIVWERNDGKFTSVPRN